ncbi:sugar ABC transporter permease [Rhizobium sp. Root708]|uniref:carbohydrate ABC transporter permease n=1 Tax=Rhizobium sp. Root708 TaxID=1736592 RepID=UPI0006F5268D|nr:sugar ABC transporter permease [Rhizobium sp. Root708]KRB49312.1 sugar ABC transporter permease [Rhizobium sp. Root708]
MERNQAAKPSVRHHPRLGFGLLVVGTVTLSAMLALQVLYTLEIITIGFDTWRPVVYAYVFWGVMLCASRILTRGEAGWRALFVLPAILFTVAIVLFPTVFAFFAAFTDWNLAGRSGPHFNGLSNLLDLVHDTYFWNALANMLFYLSTVVVQYILAFGLALLLNADIRGRKFFRVAFLMPFMLSPVAISWMIGRSMMDLRAGPVSNFMRLLGWHDPSFFTSPWAARISIAAIDAWVWIPFMIILLLAGLQAMDKEIQEAARVDGATSWQAFWQITFPLMLPVSITAILIRVIFLLKLADVVINVTAGGPGGATDTVSSFIFRMTGDRANIGYGTMLAIVYLILITVFLLLLIRTSARLVRYKEDRE